MFRLSLKILFYFFLLSSIGVVLAYMSTIFNVAFLPDWVYNAIPEINIFLLELMEFPYIRVFWDFLFFPLIPFWLGFLTLFLLSKILFSFGVSFGGIVSGLFSSHNFFGDVETRNAYNKRKKEYARNNFKKKVDNIKFRK